MSNTKQDCINLAEENRILEKLAVIEYKKNKHDKRWRIFSGKIYFIKDKSGNKIPFKPNAVQTDIYNNKHNRNIILKSRQHGVSTFFAIMFLDYAIHNPNKNLGIIAQDMKTMHEIFDDKIVFAYDNLPKNAIEELKLSKAIDRQGEMKFSNGSKLFVDTSFRGGTLQKLHISELGKIASKFPEKAREINTGALNTVAPDQEVFIESTAEGNSGLFYEKCQDSIKLVNSGYGLTELDYKFFFFPWFIDKTCQLKGNVVLTQETKDYFKKLESDRHIFDNYGKIEFTEEQKKWYQKKKEEQKDDMMREYPSTPDESFLLAVEGAYYMQEMALARKQNRITKVNYETKLLVEIAIDVGGAGGGDDMAVWFYQIFGKEIRIIDYWEGTGYTTLSLINLILKDKEYRYGTVNLPWDAEISNQNDGKNVQKTFNENGFKTKIRRNKTVMLGINQARDIFINCYFDESKCSKGLNHLDNYRREWDDRHGIFKEKAKHDEHSHGADGFRYLALSIQKETNIKSSSQIAREYFERGPIKDLG